MRHAAGIFCPWSSLRSSPGTLVLFLIFSLYLRFAPYMMSGSRHAYISGKLPALFAFIITWMRARSGPFLPPPPRWVQETGLGILAYSLSPGHLALLYPATSGNRQRTCSRRSSGCFRAWATWLLGRGPAAGHKTDR